MKKLLLGLILAGNLFAQVPSGLNSQFIGSTNALSPTTSYYWVQAITPAGRLAMVGPTVVTYYANLNQLSFVIISWFAVNGAVYDVLKTNSPVMPSGTCNCAIAIKTSAVSASDIGQVLQPYTVSSSGGAITNPSFINRLGILDTSIAAGCTPDGIGDCTAAFIAGLSTVGKKLYFPPGKYSVNNSGSTIIIPMSASAIEMDEAAQIAFTTINGSGVKIIGTGGNGVSDPNNPIEIKGLHLVWPGPATIRNGISFELSGFTNLTVTDFSSLYGAGAHLWISNSTNVMVKNANIYGGATFSLAHVDADGLHFANVQNAKVDGLYATSTGDDCFAYTNGFNFATNTNTLVATNINVENCATDGIRLEGLVHGSINGYVIKNTANDGIVIDTGVQSGATTGQSQSSSQGLEISNGKIYKAGTWGVVQYDLAAGAYTSGANGHCINIYGANTSLIHISNQILDHCGASGVNTDGNANEIWLDDIIINRATNTGLGLNLYNGTANNITTYFSGLSGFSIAANGEFHFNNLKSIDDCQDNAALRCNAGRGVQFPGPFTANSTAKVDGQVLQIIDRGSQLMGESVKFTAGTSGNITASPFPLTNTGFTCSKPPVVIASNNYTGSNAGSATLLWAGVDYPGYNCTGIGTFTNPAGDGTVTGTFTGQTGGVPVPTFTAGSGYTLANGVFNMYLPPPATGAVFGNNGVLQVTLSLGSVSGISWLRFPSQVSSNATWTPFNLQPPFGITATTYGVASIAALTALSLPANRNFYQGDNGTSVTSGSINNLEFSLPPNNFGGVTITDKQNFFVTVVSKTPNTTVSVSTTLNIQSRTVGANATTAPITVTTYQSPYAGLIQTVYKADPSANAVTYSTGSQTLVGGATTLTLASQGNSYSLLWDPTYNSNVGGWAIVGKN